MNSEDRIPLTDPSQIPSGMTEEQAREFWDSHEITEQYLEKAGPVPADDLPEFRPRTKPVSVRLDEDTLQRLRRLAELKNKGYQTLLKEFVAERLYEEEKRAGIIPSNGKRLPMMFTWADSQRHSATSVEGTRFSHEQNYMSSGGSTLMPLDTYGIRIIKKPDPARRQVAKDVLTNLPERIQEMRRDR